MLLKEIKGDTNKQKDIPGPWIGRLCSVKKPVLPKAATDLIDLYQIPIALSFAGTEKSFLKFVWNPKGRQTAKTIFKKRNKAVDLLFPGFKACYRAIVINTA